MTQPCVPLKQVLQNPAQYYNQQVTVHGLFTSELIVINDQTAYCQIVPNRLYYEYRSKWDYRVCLYLRKSVVTDLPFYHWQHAVPREDRRTAPNRNTAKIRITGTLYPPQNNHGLFVLGDVTEIVKMTEERLYHFKPDAFKHGVKALWTDYQWEVSEWKEKGKAWSHVFRPRNEEQ